MNSMASVPDLMALVPNSTDGPLFGLEPNSAPPDPILGSGPWRALLYIQKKKFLFSMTFPYPSSPFILMVKWQLTDHFLLHSKRKKNCDFPL